MDLSLFRRAQRGFASRNAAPIDFGMLRAILAMESLAGPARALAAPARAAPGIEPLVELLLCGPGWAAAAAAQRGSFNPGVAGCGVNSA